MIRLLLLALILPAHAGRLIDVRPGESGALQAVIDSIPAGRKSTYTLRLAPGTYREKIHVPAGKPPIRMTGAGEEETVIVWSDGASTLDSNGNELGTFRSATVTVESDEFSAEGIAIRNDFGLGSQAVALRVSGDRCAFRKVKLVSWQDTLLVEKRRQYFEDCAILGHVDFIFGGSTVWFENCTLTSRGNGYLTAASTPADSEFGLVFHGCRILAEKDAIRVFLGRPWQNRPATLFLDCELPAAIHPDGWDNWRDPAKEKTARYGEYRSSGPGADVAGRVKWTRQLDDAEAGSVTIGKVFDGWKP